MSSRNLSRFGIAELSIGDKKGVRTTTRVLQKKSLSAFATNLVRLRHTTQLTQTDLAKITGQNSTAISHWESGRREPSLRNIELLCAGLGCTANDLIYARRVIEIPAGRMEELWKSGAAFVKTGEANSVPDGNDSNNASRGSSPNPP